MSASQPISHRKQLALAAHAHGMRSAPSEPERLLWQALRASQLGVRFYRQVVLQGFIVDFFAPSARLVVEVDGLITHGAVVRIAARTPCSRRLVCACCDCRRNSS